jgi:mannan endo-1,4-beta-mannosidase
MTLHTSLIASLTAAVALSGCASQDNGSSPSPDASNAGPTGGFHVSGRFLFDKCENKVVLRGINEMVVWLPSDKDDRTVYEEIAKTGANVVRIVWNSTGTAAALDKTIANALAQKLIPLIEDHDATGDLSKVPAVVDYWVKPDVVQVVTKHQDKLLLNIANEAGNGGVIEDDFRTTYTDAIARLRKVGYTMPLIIDGPSWGSNITLLFATGPDLIQADPLHNILLSVHTYWIDPDGSTTKSKMQQAESNGLPLIVGEFADVKNGDCNSGSFNVSVLMQEAQDRQIGWLAWSWGAVKNSDCPGKFDMTSDGTFSGLQNWGLAVATTDANSIKNTSVLSPYIANGSCN